MTYASPILSPRMEALQQQLAAGNKAALEAFWQQIGQEGTPIVEPLDDDAAHSLVTFIWRNSGEEDGAAIVSVMSEEDGPDALALLPGSDLWFKSYRVPNEMRESYQFAVGGENVTDPLNPQQHVFPDDADIGFTGWTSSVLEMPQAAPQPWGAVRPGVPAGQVVGLINEMKTVAGVIKDIISEAGEMLKRLDRMAG